MEQQVNVQARLTLSLPAAWDEEEIGTHLRCQLGAAFQPFWDTYHTIVDRYAASPRIPSVPDGEAQGCMRSRCGLTCMSFSGKEQVRSNRINRIDCVPSNADRRSTSDCS